MLTTAGCLIAAAPAVASGDEATTASESFDESAAAPATSPATSTPTSTPTWGYALAHELMSPFCPGRTLAACTSGEAAELRQWILFQEAAGATREETLANLYERWGDVLRSSPKPEGWGLAAHLLPIAALVLGAGIVALVLRRMLGRSKSAPGPTSDPAPPAAPNDPELERRLEEELRAESLP